MRAGVLGAGAAKVTPVALNFRIDHLRHFIQSLPGQEQQLGHRPPRFTHLIAGLPEPADFLISEDAVAAYVLGRGFDSIGWRGCQNVPLFAPVEERPGMGKDAVCRGGPTGVYDLV